MTPIPPPPRTSPSCSEPPSPASVPAAVAEVRETAGSRLSLTRRMTPPRVTTAASAASSSGTAAPAAPMSATATADVPRTLLHHQLLPHQLPPRMQSPAGTLLLTPPSPRPLTSIGSPAPASPAPSVPSSGAARPTGAAGAPAGVAFISLPAPRPVRPMSMRRPSAISSTAAAAAAAAHAAAGGDAPLSPHSLLRSQSTSILPSTHRRGGGSTTLSVAPSNLSLSSRGSGSLPSSGPPSPAAAISVHPPLTASQDETLSAASAAAAAAAAAPTSRPASSRVPTAPSTPTLSEGAPSMSSLTLSSAPATPPQAWEDRFTVPQGDATIPPVPKLPDHLRIGPVVVSSYKQPAGATGSIAAKASPVDEYASMPVVPGSAWGPVDTTSDIGSGTGTARHVDPSSMPAPWWALPDDKPVVEVAHPPGLLSNRLRSPPLAAGATAAGGQPHAQPAVLLSGLWAATSSAVRRGDKSGGAASAGRWSIDESLAARAQNRRDFATAWDGGRAAWRGGGGGWRGAGGGGGARVGEGDAGESGSGAAGNSGGPKWFRGGGAGRRAAAAAEQPERV
ncbi:hypothetical protein HK405_012573 [Cladochytrium tenue]|nr:hypothetical protein HK405_012573 [Cladochytrium tenue]